MRIRSAGGLDIIAENARLFRLILAEIVDCCCCCCSVEPGNEMYVEKNKYDKCKWHHGGSKPW